MTYSAYGVNGDAANELYLHRNEDHDLHDGSMGLFKNHITHVVVHIYAIIFFLNILRLFSHYMILIVITSELTFVKTKQLY